MTGNTEELRQWAEGMDEPAGYYDEKEDSDIELGDSPTTAELRRALNATRCEVRYAMDIIRGLLERQDKDLDKLRNHRHDNSKQFGGRPEF